MAPIPSSHLSLVSTESKASLSIAHTSFACDYNRELREVVGRAVNIIILYLRVTLV